MYSIAARLLGRLDDEVATKVALGSGRRPDVVGLSAGANVQGRLIGIGVDGYRLDTHLPARPRDANGDFASISNQYLAERHPAHSGLRFSKNARRPS